MLSLRRSMADKSNTRGSQKKHKESDHRIVLKKRGNSRGRKAVTHQRPCRRNTYYTQRWMKSGNAICEDNRNSQAKAGREV